MTYIEGVISILNEEKNDVTNLIWFPFGRKSRALLVVHIKLQMISTLLRVNFILSCLSWDIMSQVSTCYKRENSFTLIVSPASLNWLLITTWFINGDSINEGNFLLEYERQTFPRATGIFMEKSTHVREKYSPSTVFMFELIKSTTRVSKSLYISIWFPTHQKTQI